MKNARLTRKQMDECPYPLQTHDGIKFFVYVAETHTTDDPNEYPLDGVVAQIKDYLGPDWFVGETGETDRPVLLGDAKFEIVAILKADYNKQYQNVF